MSKNINNRVPLSNYEDYKKFVMCQLKKRINYEKAQDWLKVHHKELLRVFVVDFESIHKDLKEIYSSKNIGKKPYDPQILIRSLLLMQEFQETGITSWVKRLQTEPMLAIFTGADSKNTPAVGTYYELFKRLENGKHQAGRILATEIRKSKSKLRKINGKPREKEEENTPEKRGVIKRLVEKTKAHENEPVSNDLERLLNDILQKVAVKISAEKELFTNVEELRVGGDGSTIPAAVNHYGTPICDCREQGIMKCDHLRNFSDKDATWGWDNIEKDYIFGYRYFQLVAADNHRNLPIYLNINPANTHEATMAIRAIDRFSKRIKVNNFAGKIKYSSFDALYDIHHFYKYLQDKGIGYAIPYAVKPPEVVTLDDTQQPFTNKGVPICPGGLPMVRHNKNKLGRNVYNCPIKRHARRGGKVIRVIHRQECPLESLCEPHSKMGPMVHVSPDLDPRIHPSVARDSKLFKSLLRMRSACERSNSMKKYSYKMKITRMRVMSYAFIRLAFISILEHSRVWVDEMLKNCDIKNIDILSLFV